MIVEIENHQNIHQNYISFNKTVLFYIILFINKR